MKQNRAGWKRSLLAAVCIAGFASCGRSDDQVLAPARHVLSGSLQSCGEQCVLFSDDRPFQLSHELPDSSGALLLLATFVVRGSAGGELALKLDLNGAVLDSATRDVVVTAQVAGAQAKFTLSELTTTRLVYDFAVADDVTVQYFIPRALSIRSINGATLSQLSLGATIQSASVPWKGEHRSSTTSLSISAFPSCTVNTASFNACGVTGTIQPFATGSATVVGCLWASASNTGASSTIEITFAQAVKNVTLTNCDADYAGNEMDAYDANGTEIGMATFAGDGVPGNNNIQTQSILQVGIRRVELRAAPLDFVAYRDLKFEQMADSIILAPLSTTRKEGQTLTFNAVAFSGGALTSTTWVWQSTSIPPNGVVITTVPAACVGQNTCTMPVYESGTMTVSGVVGNVATSQTVAQVTVTPCAANTDADPRIADPQFRKALADLSDKTTTNERVADIYTNSASHSYLPIEYPNVAPVPCIGAIPDENAAPLTPIPDGYVKDGADFHTHPFAPGTSIPSSCSPGGGVAGIGPSSGIDPQTGLETGDYAFEARRGDVLNGGNEGYLMDPAGNVFRWGPTELPSHPAWYKREKDANGRSSCLAMFTYQ